MENSVTTECLYAYARVSTKGQKEDRQLEEFKKYGIQADNIFVDKKSGKDFDREEYQFLKRILKRSEGKNNVLFIHSIDRLGRNYNAIMEEWREITKDLKADIVVLDMELLDTRKYKDLLGTFIADLVLQILAYNAQAEREKIKTNQAQGIATAKANNIKFGRPRVELPSNFKEEYSLWKDKKQTAKTTMKNLGLKRSKFYMFVRDYKSNI